MNKMNILFISILISILSAHLRAETANIDLTSGLLSKFYSDILSQQLFKKYIEDDGSLLDAGNARWIARFFTYGEMKRFSEKGLSELSPLIRDGRILNAVIYLAWMWDGENHQRDMVRLIEHYSNEKLTVLREIAGDPRLSNGQKAEALAWLQRISTDLQQRRLNAGSHPIFQYRPRMERCLDQIAPARSSMNLQAYEELALQRLDQVKRCLLSVYPARGAQPFAALDMKDVLLSHPGSVVNHSGFLPGHKTQVLNLNRNTGDTDFSNLMKAIDEGLIHPYKRHWNQFTHQQQIMQMRDLILRARAEGKDPLHLIFIEVPGGQPDEILYTLRSGRFFTKADAMKIESHPLWQFYGESKDHAKQTFPMIIETMKKAEKSIFVNLFFFGGSMGLSMSDFLLKELERKPHLKLLMVRDQVNHFGHRGEMAPVYNYLRAQMSLQPNRMLILPSNVYEKQINGFPDFFKNFLSQDFLNRLGLDEKFSLYIKAQSDHSKILVVDGEDLQGNPKMIIGSKNWTDSSGSICNDENILIEGPMAVVALDQYFQDLYMGLVSDWNPKDSFLNSFYEEIYQKGWAQESQCKMASQSRNEREKKIYQMLCPFDLFKRYRFDLNDSNLMANFSQMTPILVKSKGPTVARFGENSATASATTVLNQNLQAIDSARKQILINEQLFYAPALVDALVEKAKQGVEVKVLLEGFIHEGAAFPGMPNLIYLDVLKKAGVEVKWKTHAPFPHFFPEHHGKTISIDGYRSTGERVRGGHSIPQVIIGSANKDLLTMKGGFRESQVGVFDVQAAKDHDELFWKNWNNPAESKVANFEDFNQAPLGQKIRRQGFTTELFMSYVAEMIEAIYSMKVIAR